MAQPKSPEWRKDQIPTELIQLTKDIEQLPLHIRQKLLPLCERLHHYNRLHSRLLKIAQEAVDQLQLDAKYMMFDLEATRRERDELLRELRGLDEEVQ
ncbi:MAG: transcriptional regulator [Planctomycetes bacterium]|nr:transcriptional regulator [Planctomycetota bacterium]